MSPKSPNAPQPPDFPVLPDPTGSRGASKPSSSASPGKRPPAGIPMLRAFGKGGGTLRGRLRGLKSKEIVFIVAGLAVLILAPITEHMISSPEDEGGTLQQGFSAPGSGLFGGENPYEPGIISIAQGHLPGQGTEVVTPLNVRDPASLIMSPGGEEKKPVQPIEPPKTPAQPERGWSDALASAAKKGVSKATEKVRLPMPGAKLAKISGLGPPSGGTQASLSLAAPSSQGLFSNPGAGGHMRVTSAPGYRGADRRSLSGGGSATEGYGGGRFGPGGTSGAGTWDGGSGGSGGVLSGPPGGSPGPGDADKSGGGAAAEGTKNINITQKEDLAWLRRKMEMEKFIDLKWAKKKYDQLERKKMLEELAAQTAQQAFMKILDKLLGNSKAGGEEKKAEAGGGKSDGKEGSGTGSAGPAEPQPKPKPGDAALTFRQDLARLEAADRDVQGAVGAMGSAPPSAGGIPRLAGIDQVKAKTARIAEADGKLGEGIRELSRMSSPELKNGDPKLEKYPAFPSGQPQEVLERLAKQKGKFIEMTTGAADTATGVKGANDRIISKRGELAGLRPSTQGAFSEAERAALEARARALEAKTAVETANRALARLAQGYASADEAGKRELERRAEEAIGDARAVQEALTSSVAEVRNTIASAQTRQEELKRTSSELEEVRARYVWGMDRLSSLAQDLTTRSRLLARGNAFDRQIAPVIAGEGRISGENRQSLVGSQEAAKRGGPLVSTAVSDYGSIVGTLGTTYR